MPVSATRDGRLRAARLLAIGVAAAVVAVGAAGFVTLYLSLPAGTTPLFGLARDPRVGPFATLATYPTLRLDLHGFQKAALTLLLSTWALYAALGFMLGRLPDRGERHRALVLVAGLAVWARLLLVAIPPTLASDPFDLHGHHGPGFRWIVVALTAVGRHDPLATALAFKLAAALADLATCWLVWRLSREAGDRDGLQPLALYAFNPLVLVELAGNGHADAFMIFFALVGLWLARRRALPGVAVLVISAATRYLTAVLVPIAIAHEVATAEEGTRARRASRLLGVAALTALVLYVPLWRDWIEWRPALALRPAIPWLLLVVAVGLASAAATRLPRSRLAELGATLTLASVLALFVWRHPWAFTTPIALTLVAPASSTNRALRLIALWLGCLAMLLYTALVPVGG
jgi:hypothetical protein